MKILMATMGLDIGGAETHIVELAKELKRRGHDIAIASNGGVYVEEIEKLGIRHYTVPMNRRSAVPMAKSALMMRKIIKKEKPDVVHAHARIPGFICGLLHKSLRFPFVTTAHWVFNTEGALRFLTNWGEKTVAVSEDIKEYLKVNYGVKDGDIFVTINGIDTDRFSPKISGEKVRNEFGIGENAPVISHVSRMDESRALAARHLIDMARELDERIPGVVILIAGDGDVFNELSQKAERVNADLKRKCVVMAGARTDINVIVAAGDIFVGVSRAALEAMSAAKPTLVAGNEGYLGIFTEEKLSEAIESNFCCRGCPQIDHDAMLSDAVKLMTMTEEEREKLGAYGRQVIIEHYSVGRMADDNMRAYRAAIPPKKIVMSGYYGFGNAGDEAILESVYGSIKRILPDAKVTVLSKTPENTAKTYGCDAAARFDPLAIRRAVKGCDVLVSGGGSLLQDTTSTRSLLYYLSIIRMAERFGKKVMLFANGIGPVTKRANRKKVAKAVMGADAVTLRDPGSYSELLSMGVERDDMAVTADPVFLLSPADEKAAERILKDAGVPEGPFVTASVRPWEESGGFGEKLAAICDRIYTEYGRSVVFITMQPGRDDNEGRRIADKMKSPAYVLPGGYGARELMAVIGKSDLVLSMRLHSLIFAARMAVPAVGFSYDPKIDAYLRLLNQPSAGSVGSASEDAALRAVADILNNREERVRELQEKRDKLCAAAEENEKWLRELCE